MNLPEKPKLTEEEQRAVLRASPTFENLVQAIKASVIQDRLDARAAARAAGLPEPPMDFPWDKKTGRDTTVSAEAVPGNSEATPPGGLAGEGLPPERLPPERGGDGRLGCHQQSSATDPPPEVVPPPNPQSLAPERVAEIRIPQSRHWIGSRPEDEATDEAIALYEERQEWERKMEADYI